jgi:sulfite reductase (NADPH) hemoprotein beta-component
MPENNPLSSVERIKQQSQGLRGTIREGLLDEITGAISEEDQALLKFHGMYQQDDRDRREERAEKKLERLYSFMIRLRLPGGFLRPEQWIAAHHIAGEFATGIIKITTRQTLQLHGLIKSKIKPTIQAFNQVGLDSIATCGDINRNVICSANPMQSPVHEQVHAYTSKISQLLMPKTRAYYEIWLGEEMIAEKKEEDPLYQDRYLPRKFKIGIAIPPNNDIDVFANDIGLIAIIENQELIGFNIAIGGGLSTTHGNPATYARLASEIGFLAGEENILRAIYAIVTIQRDFGNRSDRKMARLKYTIDNHSLGWFKEEVERRIGQALEPSRPYAFTSRQDYFGWEKDHGGKWHYTLYAENGRILDDEKIKLKSALLQIARTGLANFRFTGNQNLILADIDPGQREAIDKLLRDFGILEYMQRLTPVRKNSMACVALNTCPLALAEGQRYLPSLIDKIEVLLEKNDLNQEEVIIRMTGCPNGCGRPNLAEIGFVGTSYGRYNLHLGSDQSGTRLNKLYKENLEEKAILEELDGLFASFRKHRNPGERLGDFSLRMHFIS